MRTRYLNSIILAGLLSIFVSGCDLFGDTVTAISEACSRTILVTTTEDRRRDTCAVDDCSLHEAINLANFCNATNTIQISDGEYGILTPAPSASRYAGRGPNGLPVITANITISAVTSGGSTAIIRRLSGDDSNAFRLFYVAPGAGLILRGDIAVRDGLADDGVGGETDADYGGGIYNDGTLTVRNGSLIENNRAAYVGGGVYNKGSMIMSGELNNNEAGSLGGGIANASEGDVVAGRAIFFSNTARSGGAMHNNVSGQVTISTSTLNANVASGGNGGAVANWGSLGISQSAFLNNRVSGGFDGGAIYSNASYDSELMFEIQASTFSNNNAEGSAGGIFAVTGNRGYYRWVEVRIIDSTIYRSGGDGISGDAAFNIRNTIIANSTGTDCTASRSIDSEGTVNLDSDGSCSFTTTADPMLDDIAYNGGSTQNHRPRAGSPAIDTGFVCLPNDQRDYTRPIDVLDVGGSLTCDIGAIEVQDGLPPGAGGGGGDEGDGGDQPTDTGGDQPGDQPDDTPDTPPTVAITSPGDGSSYTADQLDQQSNQWYYDVTLKGEGTDAEDGTLSGGSLVWTVSPAIDGSTALGTGETINAKLYGTSCGGDSYVITLTGTDSDGNSISTSITLISSLFC